MVLDTTGRRASAAEGAKNVRAKQATAAESIAAIQGWAADHGRVPTEREWERAADGHPSAQSVRQRFGSWKGGLAAAGYAQEPGHRPGMRSVTT